MKRAGSIFAVSDASRGRHRGCGPSGAVLCVAHGGVLQHHRYGLFAGELCRGRGGDKQAGFLVQLVALWVGDAIPEAGEDGEEPCPAVVPEHLLEVVHLPEVEGQFVGAVSEDRRSEGFQRRHVLRDEIAVVEEEGGQAQAEHCGHKEEEQDMEPGNKERNIYGDIIKMGRHGLDSLSVCVRHVRGPEFEEVFEGGECDVYAVEECVAQKEDEEFVVLKGHTVVHPWTVMIHLI